MGTETRVEQLEKRADKLDETLGSVVKAVSEIAADFKFTREKINGYLETHDKVIRMEEQIKTANNRILDLEDDQKEHAKEISTIKVKYAGIATIISIIGSFITTILMSAAQ